MKKGCSASPVWITELAVTGQPGNLVPADKKLYALRDAIGAVDSLPLIASSVMSKKIAAGADAIVLDVKVGNGAFMASTEAARVLAQRMVDIGNGADRPDRVAAQSQVEEDLCCGPALAYLRRIIEAQQGNPGIVNDYRLLPQPIHQLPVLSTHAGFITSFDTQAIDRAAMHLGAGRATATDLIDPAVGLVLHKRLGSPVEVGEPLATLHVGRSGDLETARHILSRAIGIGSVAPSRAKLILARIE